MSAPADGKRRCRWVAGGNALYYDYHDREWGVPVHDDGVHFEFLLLEGAQAGLSWATVLNKRENYRRAFAGFDPAKVARFTDKKKQRLLADPGIIRNRLKIDAAIGNAKTFLAVAKEFGSFDAYVWRFVGGAPRKNKPRGFPPVTSEEAQKLSKDLKKRGFKFVGETIIYSYMQAVGLVNDHEINCFRQGQIRGK